MLIRYHSTVGRPDFHIKKNHARASRPELVEPLELDYHGARISLAGGLTAGPTLARSLDVLGGVKLQAARRRITRRGRGRI